MIENLKISLIFLFRLFCLLMINFLPLWFLIVIYVTCDLGSIKNQRSVDEYMVMIYFFNLFWSLCLPALSEVLYKLFGGLLTWFIVTVNILLPVILLLILNMLNSFFSFGSSLDLKDDDMLGILLFTQVVWFFIYSYSYAAASG